jgi:hypothetical protein
MWFETSSATLVQMLVIDEVHTLLASTYRQQRILLNTLRYLANELRIPLICAGTADARIALTTDPQLADRFEALNCRSGKTMKPSSACWPVSNLYFPCGRDPILRARLLGDCFWIEPKV